MQRNFYTLVGIVVVVLLAIVIDLSGTSLYTLNLGHKITVAQGLDLQGGARVILDAVPARGQVLTDDDMNNTRSIIESRVNGAFGVSEPVVQAGKSGNTRFISVELPGLRKDLASVEDVLKRTGQLTIVALDSKQLPPGASAKGYRVLVKGTDLDSKGISVGQDTVGRATVNVTLHDPGATNVATYSQGHVGSYMGIAIDNVINSSPVIQSPLLGGTFEISNVGTHADAVALATILKYGALPVPLKIAGIQSVSASLGPANIRASLLAGAVGLLIVMLFMVFYYRLPGLLADAALLIYAGVVFAIFKAIPVTLTLAGTAGFILSIGMAVDANILIFERMKEELRAGRSVGAATDAGFARAWPSIRDSNISTMITCAILYWFGSNFAASIIVGFATTLFIGVVISMITAILVSRTFLRLVLSGTRTANRALFGAGI